MENYCELNYLSFLKRQMEMNHRANPIVFEKTRELRLALLKALVEEGNNDKVLLEHHLLKALELCSSELYISYRL